MFYIMVGNKEVTHHTTSSICFENITKCFPKSYYPQSHNKLCKYKILLYPGHNSSDKMEITIDLNLKKKSLSFYVNNQFKGIAFDNIQIDNHITYYYLAVSLSSRLSNAMITDFCITSI